MNLPVVVIGAGPIGLILALLLNRAGKSVKVYEATQTIKPLGVGINLLPHSVRVLADLGLQSELDDIGIRTGALHYYNKFGQQIWAEARGLGAGYRYPQYSVHRGQLQLMLLEQVRRALGPESVATGHRFVDWQETANYTDSIVARFSRSGESESTPLEVEAQCIVAADGINSTARSILFPQEGEALYGGRLLWRGTSMAKPFLDGRTMFMAGHQDCKFVAYPLGEVAEGRQLLNWIAELSVADWKPERQDWSRRVSAEKFVQQFNDWNFGWVDIPALISDCDAIYEFPLSDRDPLPKWSHGNLTLIGDAAHPMYPIGSNGASQGILDAEKLVQELRSGKAINQAFDAYEAERRPATSSIVRSNRKNGPEQVMQLAHERAPQGFNDIEQVIPRAELEAIAAKYKQTAGFSLAEVNRKSR